MFIEDSSNTEEGPSANPAALPLWALRIEKGDVVQREKGGEGRREEKGGKQRGGPVLHDQIGLNLTTHVSTRHTHCNSKDLRSASDS